MSNTFEVVFNGVVIDGYDAAETRAKIGKLFNADEAKIARLFSGNSVVIKKDLDEATANKYIGAFKKAGAHAVVRNTAAATEKATAPAAAVAPPAQRAEPAAPAVTSSTSVFEHSGEASEHVTAAPQTQLNLNSNPDLSELSLRENTGNLVDPSEEVPEASFDLSEFSLAEAGADIGDKKEDPPPLNADLSGISLLDD
ncbi:MAG: hypothetical protein OEY29_12005 [Gammaproteobacteria bacterium]|nr:hypothetical protein [Gammaproteobacteria bacterium]